MTTIVEIQINPETGDQFIELPDDIIKSLDLHEGDEVDWNIKEDGSILMTKKKNTKLVMVDVLAQYRMRYLVEVPDGETEWALDVVTCEEAKEFSQKYLGETIISHRIVSEEEALRMCDQDNDYLKSWSDDNKKNAFFTRISDYKK